MDIESPSIHLGKLKHTARLPRSHIQNKNQPVNSPRSKRFPQPQFEKSPKSTHLAPPKINISPPSSIFNSLLSNSMMSPFFTPFLSLSLHLFSIFLLSPAPPSSAQSQNFSSLNVSNSPWSPTQNRILLSPNSSFAAGFLPSTSDLYTFSVW